MTTEQENTKTPKWLRRLEKESWQAELLISGLALYGTLQLPVFVYWLSDSIINLFPVDYYFAGYIISFFYLFGISILTTFFIMHFVLRAYWVGLIGLNSVYPEGYKVDNEIFSSLFTQKVVDYFPKVPDTIKALDKQCSGMFSGAFVFILMYGMMSISFSILLAVYMATIDYIPKLAWIILGAIFVLITIFVLIFTYLGKSKKYKDNEKLQDRFFKLSVLYGNIMTPFLYKHLSQITYTFQTHAKNVSSSFTVVLPFMIIATALSMYHLDQSNIGILINKGKEDAINIHENTIYSNNYLDQYTEDQNIFVPILDSDIVSGPFVKLFIPILSNEKTFQETICGEYVKTKILKDNAERIAKRKFFHECYSQYIRVYVNENLHNAELLVHEHKQRDRRGVLSYIPSTLLKPGKNTLRVEKIKNKKNEIYEDYLIHFWYDAN